MSEREMNTAIAEHLAKGWRVESDGGERVVLVKGEARRDREARQRKPNHLLHLLLSVFTAGLWIPVWALIAMRSSASRRVGRWTAGEERKVLSVRDGRVVES